MNLILLPPNIKPFTSFQLKINFLTQPLMNCACNLALQISPAQIFSCHRAPFLLPNGHHTLPDQGPLYVLLPCHRIAPPHTSPMLLLQVFIAPCICPSIVLITDIIKVCFSIRNHACLLHHPDPGS